MTNHPIVHLDIPAGDTKAAGKFYAEAFGWNVHTDASFDYTMFQAEGGPGGGFVQVGNMQGAEIKPGNVLIYIGTDDIEASLAKVQALGGTIITPKTEIPQIGWFGVFADPTGNKIGLYTDIHQH